MAAEPPEPLRAGQRSASREHTGPSERGDSREPHDEHEGPVAIARYVKPDGRALIIYTRETRPAA